MTLGLVSGAVRSVPRDNGRCKWGTAGRGSARAWPHLSSTGLCFQSERLRLLVSTTNNMFVVNIGDRAVRWGRSLAFRKRSRAGQTVTCARLTGLCASSASAEHHLLRTGICLHKERFRLPHAWLCLPSERLRLPVKFRNNLFVVDSGERSCSLGTHSLACRRSPSLGK